MISRVRCDEILSLDREVWKISQDGELAAHLLLLDVHGHVIVGPCHPHACTEDVAYKPGFLIIPAGLLGTAWTVSPGMDLGLLLRHDMLSHLLSSVIGLISDSHYS